MVTLAQSNAHRMNVRDHITFRTGDACELIKQDQKLHSYFGSVSNPPYGDRMETTKQIADFITILFGSENIFGGFISNSESDYQQWSKIATKNRKLQHGGKLAYFYYHPLQKNFVKKEERK